MPKSVMGTLLGPVRPSCILLCLAILAVGVPVSAQVQPPSTAPPATASSPGAGQSPEQSAETGIIMGTVVDATGASVAGARVELTGGDRPAQETAADATGQFFFANVAPGPFRLTITAQGFAPQTASGILHGGESLTVPQINMALAAVVTQVQVSPAEEAKVELHAEEKQRVLGVIPNFYVSYVPEAAPLAPRQKFQLAWKATIDPVTVAVVGATAGFEQATNYYSGYGQGAQGYGKRFGATYANVLTSTFIGDAILPSLLKQDPRYFYRGTGSRPSRLLYALGYTFFCKGDNGRYQPNYSALGGIFISSGIGNAYYPSTDRGVGRTLEGALIGVAGSSAANVLEEFIVSRFTSRAPQNVPSTSGD
jgi:Carboxypeptidase regulatory-like domain